MEDCKYIQDLLPFYLDGDVLTEAEARAVKQHTVFCAACREELEDMQKNAEALHLLGRSIFQAPSVLSARVMEQLRSEKTGSVLGDVVSMKKPASSPSRLIPRRFAGGIAAAAVFAVVAAGVPRLLPDPAPVQIAQEESGHTESLPPSVSADTETAPAVSEPMTPKTAPEQTGSVAPTVTEEPVTPMPEEVTVTPEAAVEPDVTEPAAELVDTVPVPEPTEQVPVVPTEPESVSIPSQNVVLLNQDDQIRSTLLKVAFADVEAAVGHLEALADECGADITDVASSSDGSCEIFTLQVPREQADGFIVSVTEAGFVLTQEQDFKTSVYSQLMEEYLQLQAQLSASDSEEVSIQLKTQLAEVEQEMNAAQQDVAYESVIIWIQMTE